MSLLALQIDNQYELKTVKEEKLVVGLAPREASQCQQEDLAKVLGVRGFWWCGLVDSRESGGEEVPELQSLSALELDTKGRVGTQEGPVHGRDIARGTFDPYPTTQTPQFPSCPTHDLWGYQCPKTES